ncbi:flagellar basal body protein FliL [Paracoccus sp. M683]|uniref:flagellar basal body-associated FliL family protein n=1 Tax=Paracoccus sp. M683 TaxID=2594268 RepID=UPI00117CAC1A|nr:flagellar basal body-associated FliL family protein [Paracoccus sp. M683]TRW95514.1 flagellar basal body protein FliL [Paracoccus sp. M683]
MQAEAATNVETEPGRRRLLLPLIAAVALGGAGFGSTYLGLWAPLDMVMKSPGKAVASKDEAAVFVAVPPIELSLAGGRHRTLVLSATIETDEAAEQQIEALLPRVVDSFNGFLSDIDPAAFDKRGVLEIIKYELTARAGEALPGLTVNDLLITEFRLK